jgi:hypothetical protein
MMKKLIKLFLFPAWLALLLIAHNAIAFASTPAGTTGYLIANDDHGVGQPNSATFFTIAADGTLSNPTQINLGGVGSGGGFFAANRAVILNNASSPCVYFSQGVSSTITGVQALTQTVAGHFSASNADDGTENGVGMVMNGNYLYASFSTSATLATFSVQSGCALQFVSDISPVGLNGGSVKGMALYGNLLVVTYGDGSIESFNVSNGVPVSNGDAQTSAGSAIDDMPDGVVITADGHYAIFGDDSSDAAVEVSDISSGHLTQTVLYNLPDGFNSNNVLLSPDQTLLYVVHNTSGQVSAAFFDKTTGKVGGSCISAQLNGFDDSFSFLATPVTQLTTGTGGALYIAEFGSSIGVLNVSASDGQCTLTETPASPVTDPNSLGLLSLAVLQVAQPGLYSPTPVERSTNGDRVLDRRGICSRRQSVLSVRKPAHDHPLGYSH